MRDLELSLDEVKNLLPETTTLTYLSYDDNFDERPELIQEALHIGWDALCDSHEWFGDMEDDAIQTYKDELVAKIMHIHECDQLDAEAIVDHYEDEIRETIQDRRDDDPVDEALKKTTGLIAHYDTGYYMEGESWNWRDSRLDLEVINIKKHLGIESNAHDEAIRMMVRQATYGGQLLIFFKMNPIDFIGDFPMRKTIQFTNAMIGVIEHGNGSGDTCEVPINEVITLPWSRENVFLEKSIKYNWTYAIAGMCSDWADSTKVEFTDIDSGEIPKSKTNDHLEQERQYNETFKNGGCTYGDMDIKRHRNTPYSNDYPCGNTCTECGTFWID